MKILIIGTGYVGLVSGTCFANLGHEIVCVDNNPEKINKLNNGQVPFFEPGLEDLIIKNKQAGRLQFKNTITEDLNNSDAVFIAVGTPPKENGHANLQYVFNVAQEIGRNLKNYTVIVTKSTVPIGTSKKVKRIIQQNYSGEFDVASCPEFLREGSAINDFSKPDRIVYGTETEKAKLILRQVHEKLICPKIETDIASSELIKYASNSFLATKISFINEIANVCESVGANIDTVAEGMGLDSRIGPKFLKAGLGYGGSCFPKDVRALQSLSGENGYQFQLLKSVIDVNNYQRWRFFHKIKAEIGDLNGKIISLWGLAFKAQTDDIRESIALDLAEKLLEEGAHIQVYDPQATENAKLVLGYKPQYCQSALDACKAADALVIVTEWSEFIDINLDQVALVMRNKKIFDGRNLLNKQSVEEKGFKYFSVGREST